MDHVETQNPHGMGEGVWRLVPVADWDAAANRHNGFTLAQPHQAGAGEPLAPEGDSELPDEGLPDETDDAFARPL